MKTLYLHVGMHKTGSTSIQHALNKERDRLIGQGVYFPLTATMDNTRAHQNIAWELNKHGRFEPEVGTLADLHGELAQHRPDKVILSSEGFTSMDTVSGTTRFRRLKDFADSLGYGIVTIGFVREYVGCVNSAYTQQVKTLKHARSFDEYVAEQHDMERWCYEGVFAGWEGISREVICLASGDDNVGALFQILGVEGPGAAGHARMNTGVGPRTIECSRILVRSLLQGMYSGADGRPGKLRRRLREDTGGGKPNRLIRKQAIAHGWDDELFWGFDVEQARQLHAVFSSRDEKFLGKHRIQFSQGFLNKSANDFLLERAEGRQRQDFVNAVNEILVKLGGAPLADTGPGARSLA